MSCTIKSSSPLKWPNNKVPYKIGASVSTKLKRKIQDALNYVNSIFIGIKPEWVEHTNESNYVEFTQIVGTSNSPVGMKSSRQQIELGARASVGTVIHEMFHSMGVNHEMTRPDRDEHIKIFPEHIKPQKRHNYTKLSNSEAETWGTSFDFESIMMYKPSEWTFTSTFEFVDFFPHNSNSISTLYCYSPEMSLFKIYNSRYELIRSIQLGLSWNHQIQFFIIDGINYCLFYDSASGKVTTSQTDTDLHGTTINVLDKGFDLLTLIQDTELNNYLVGYTRSTGFATIYKLKNHQYFRKTASISNWSKNWTILIGFKLYRTVQNSTPIHCIFCYNENSGDFLYYSITPNGIFSSLKSDKTSKHWTNIKIISCATPEGKNVTLLFRYNGVDPDMEILLIEYDNSLKETLLVKASIGHDFDQFSITNLYLSESTKEISFTCFFYNSENGHFLGAWKKYNYETKTLLFTGDRYLSGLNYTHVGYSGSINSKRPTANDILGLNKLYE